MMAEALILHQITIREAAHTAAALAQVLKNQMCCKRTHRRWTIKQQMDPIKKKGCLMRQPFVFALTCPKMDRLAKRSGLFMREEETFKPVGSLGFLTQGF